MHKDGGRWVGSNKVVELKKKKKERIPQFMGVTKSWIRLNDVHSVDFFFFFFTQWTL